MLKRDVAGAIADFDEAIRLNPRDAMAFGLRGAAYQYEGDFDRAVADYSEGLRLNPRIPNFYDLRGRAYSLKRDHDRAIGDYSHAIKLNPKAASVYNARGWEHYLKGDYERAIADANKAIGLDGKKADYYHTRGDVYLALQQYDRAIGDFDKALALDATHLDSLASRGKANEAKGDRDKALQDYNKALALPRSALPVISAHQAERQAEVRRRLAMLQPAPPPTTPAAAPPAVALPASIPIGRRVALLIGNAAYRKVDPLPNPKKDATDLAAALRAAGFVDVSLLYDLGLREMQRALAAFEAKAAGADWAVVYYGGHGIQVDDRNYLVPIDAELKSASDVEDETVGLDRVLARIAAAGKLQLVILDACRDNPFKRGWGRGTRTVAERGLARIEPKHPNIFIAYAARDGEAALDGQPGDNSPYAKALVKYLAEPGLELNMFFRRVRDDVLAQTGGKQRPFEYGSLTSENLFFRR